MDKQTSEIFKAQYDSIHESLDRFCRMIAGNKEDGADLLQETVLTTLKNYQKIKNKAALKSFMFSTASNINKKRISRKRHFVGFETEEVSHLYDQIVSAEELTDLSIVYERLLELPIKMREAILLFYISDLSLEDIQKIQGGSLSGVKLRIKRGKEKLLKMLNEREQLLLTIFLTV